MAKKRVNGEGTIGKRKDGRWEARYIAGRDPETGKQIRKSILGKTQAEVRTKLKEALAEATEIDVVKSGEYNIFTRKHPVIKAMHSKGVPDVMWTRTVS